MYNFLLGKGFQPETLDLLNADNLAKLAADYGYTK